MRVALLLAIAACAAEPPIADESSDDVSGRRVRPSQIIDHGGPVLAHPNLVTVTFAGYRFASKVQAFGDFLVGSNWLASAGAEYGVGDGTHVARVMLDEVAPAVVTAADIRRLLVARIDAGVLPAGDDFLYVVYFPASTEVDMFAGDGSCAAGYGYHEGVLTAAHRFAYAAIPDCSAFDPHIAYESILFPDASHEIIEAATNPFPIDDPAYWLGAPSDPWSQFGGEVADACAGLNVEEGGFALTRVYSNAAAQRGDDPCQPAGGEVYFGASPSRNVYTGAPGDVLHIPLHAWATGSIASWNVTATRGYDSAFAVHPALNATHARPGQSLVLTVTIPATARRGSVGSVFVSSFATWPDPVPYSLLAFPRFDWPVAIVVR
jgi:hypothetical protein